MINFDFISHDDSQTAESAVRAFRIMRERSWFERIDQKEYIVWTDCGKHFRNKTLVGYLLCELAKVNGIHGMPINFNFKSNLFQLIFKSIVSINFFGEKHGKNQRDTHFSNISRFIHAESLVKRLTSSQDIADAIM